MGACRPRGPWLPVLSAACCRCFGPLLPAEEPNPDDRLRPPGSLWRQSLTSGAIAAPPRPEPQPSLLAVRYGVRSGSAGPQSHAPKKSTPPFRKAQGDLSKKFPDFKRLDGKSSFVPPAASFLVGMSSGDPVLERDGIKVMPCCGSLRLWLRDSSMPDSIAKKMKESL